MMDDDGDDGDVESVLDSADRRQGSREMEIFDEWKKNNGTRREIAGREREAVMVNVLDDRNPDEKMEEMGGMEAVLILLSRPLMRQWISRFGQ
jgi:hypothetical protein